MKEYFLLYLFYFVSITQSLNESCIVQTASGLIKGKINNYNGFRYYSFQGIPYAESPTGDRRFASPVPKKPWSHILDASREGPVCIQSSTIYKKEEMSEDCLFLNIYVPENSMNKYLPTLINLHGGGLNILSGNSGYIYGPQFLLQRELIYISVNFRLNVFGFLSLNVNEVSGNAAVKDIILSLQWVQRNIVNFRGNNKKITIMGHSTGASLAHLLMFSTKTKQLFHQVILISGSAINYRAFSRYPIDMAHMLAKELNIKTNDTNNLIAALMEMDTFDILGAFLRLADANINILRTYPLFAPCVEKDTLHGIYQTSLQEILVNGLPQNIRVLAGFNTNEGIYMIPTILSNIKTFKDLDGNCELLIPSNIEYPRRSLQAKQLGESICKLYFENNEVSNDSYHETRLKSLIKFITDVHYIYYIVLWIKQHKSRRDSKELYFYELAFDGQLNWAKLKYNISFPGVSHADELGYLFLTKATRKLFDENKIDDRSRRVSSTMLDLFTNFVKYGNPTPPEVKSDILWPEYGEEENYLQINDELKVMQWNSSEASIGYYFWQSVYEKFYQYVEKGGIRHKNIF